MEPKPDLDVLHLAAMVVRDQPDLLRARLDRLRWNQRELKGVAATLHPNGFAKVVLHAEDGWGIRLHVWSRLFRLPVIEPNPHGHQWDFASWIITGTLRDTPFVPGNGIRYDRRDYRRNPDGMAQLSENGRVETLSAGAHIDRLPGTVYARPGSELHRAEPLNGDLLASLVLQGPHSAKPTAVYLRIGAPSAHHEPRLAPYELRTLLSEVIEALPE